MTFMANSFILHPSASSYYDVVMADSPVAYWRLNETSGTTGYDSAGSYDGTYSGSPTLGETALVVGGGTCVDFTGSGGLGAAATPLGGGDISVFSIEAWIKLSSIASNSFIYEQRDSSSNVNVSLTYRSSSGKIRFDKYPPSDQSIESTTTISADVLYHIVYVEDGSSRKLYVNGSLDASDTSAETYTTTDVTHWAVGARAYFLDNPAQGHIDEVAVYTSALSSTQVSAHYNAGT